MKLASCLSLLLLFSLTAAGADSNFMTLDGDRFHADRVVFAPKDCEGFLFLDAYRGGKLKATRLDFHGTLKGRPIELQLYFPLWQKGSVELVPGDGDAWNLVHWAMLIEGDGDTYGSGMQAKLRKVKVDVTRYDPAGGQIEGTFSGTLFTTESGPYRQVDIEVSGHFALKRGADVKSF
jgi:hypothetical protein